jgi:DNA-directed RNA polymerase beta' subunit
VLEKGGVKDLIAEVYELCGQEPTTEVADAIKRIGFEYAMRSGTTIAVSDITIPPEKEEIIDAALRNVEVVQRDFRRGLLTEQEQNERVIQIWQQHHQRCCQGRQETTWIRMATWPPWPTPAPPKVVSAHQPVGWHARPDG